jgi:predicted ATPase
VVEALEAARVVTLTGVGGVGKTRLALQVAAELLPRFADGAWLVELGPIRDPEAVAGACVAALGMGSPAAPNTSASVVEFFRTKELLLVVDNCEHVLGAAAELVEELERSCPHLVVLATSREGLAIEGERVVPIPTLAAPGQGADVEAVASSEAGRLFAERARAVDPDFELEAGNAEAVLQVCGRLDGLPLAIELAAARTVAMTPAELAGGLDRRFDTLSGGWRRAIPRHQTLRAAIDWSYDLLSRAEQQVLARLAVFAGGCTREAAEAVCAPDSMPPGQVFEALVSLVAKHLVVAHKEGRQTRYRLLETIREYADERLAAENATLATRRRHLDYFLGVAANLGEHVPGSDIWEDRDNFTAALVYAVETADADRALRLLTAWDQGNQLLVWLRVSELSGGSAVLSLPGAADHPRYPLALAGAAQNAAMRVDLPRARTLIDEAQAALDRSPMPLPTVEVALSMARAAVAFVGGQPAAAAEHYLKAARMSGATPLGAQALGSAAMYFVMADELERAEPVGREGVQLARQLNLPILVAISLTALAGSMAVRDPHQARLRFREAVRLRQQHHSMLLASGQTVFIAGRLDDWEAVLDLAPPAISELHWLGDRPILAGVLNMVAGALAPVQPERAAVILGIARSLGLGGYRSAMGSEDRTSQASRPGGFVVEIRRQTTSRLRHSIGEPRFAELRDEGEAMAYEEVVKYVLASIDRARQDLTTA